mmetsp:Transcript_12023/g.17620  ORF Transcript_12023/g.17620 Transcript_12023/m.17620 type:complete len:297 (-) Transcript_12023:2076-2966(-)
MEPRLLPTMENEKIDNLNGFRSSNEIEIQEVLRIQDINEREVMKFLSCCPYCHNQTENNMCLTHIPHFKEVIIMSLLCESCGFKSNEIKSGGSISEFGTKITLRVKCMEDLAREVLKSDTAGLSIPELDLKVTEGSLGGCYTTIEGLLNKIYCQLKLVYPLGISDASKKQHLNNDIAGKSEPSSSNTLFCKFLQRLKSLANGESFPFSIIISDPLSNSFISPLPKDVLALCKQAKEDNRSCYNNFVDKGIELEEFKRSYDQNEILGINDINTENYKKRVFKAKEFKHSDARQEPSG